ncbi:MAG TPA: phospho-sugar mutase [Acidimicrobiales bacterium]
MNQELRDSVVAWIAGDPDGDDRATLQDLLDRDDATELERRFAAPLTFGTAGLRGPVMAGPAGMNRYTVRRATQGVIAWMLERGVDTERGVVVGRDGRHGSEKFNNEVVRVLLGAGVKVYEMPGPLPTPLVAYCVRALEAEAGIMITASHNPPLDNGFKLYSSDGSQIIPPNDELVERYANAATTLALAERPSSRHRWISDDVFAHYQAHFAERFGVDEGDFAIVYTPLHGVGGDTMMSLFAAAGHKTVTVVAEQFAPDPTFPTLPFPNPEEPGALDLATATADRVGADLVIANDPDADRLGAAVRGPSGWHVLRGDEIGWLLASTMLPEMTSASDVVATTIVSSTLLRLMAQQAGVRFAMTLTGFKWLARAAGEETLRLGYEEALGFAVDPLVADKDGLSAALALSKLAVELRREGKSLLDRLDEIEAHFGVHSIHQLSLRAEGTGGLVAIKHAVQSMREKPPVDLGGIAVSEVFDLADGFEGLGPTDGLLLRLGASGRVVVRPSGTEPKLKAYIEITAPPAGIARLADQRRACAKQVDAVTTDLRDLLRV